MRVGDEHEVHKRHEREIEPRVAAAFDDSVPLRPVRVDDDGVVGKLDEKRGVADPGDSDFSSFGRMGDGGFDGSVTFLKCLRDESVPEKVVVAPRPAFFREKSGVVFAFFGFRCVGGLLGHTEVKWMKRNDGAKRMNRGFEKKSVSHSEPR